MHIKRKKNMLGDILTLILWNLSYETQEEIKAILLYLYCPCIIYSNDTYYII